MDVYQGEHFRAVSLSLQDSGSMYFLLPDENTDVNELVSDPDLMKVIRRDESSDNWYSPMVNLSVPKFKVSEKIRPDRNGARTRCNGCAGCGSGRFQPINRGQREFIPEQSRPRRHA